MDPKSWFSKNQTTKLKVLIREYNTLENVRDNMKEILDKIHYQGPEKYEKFVLSETNQTLRVEFFTKPGPTRQELLDRLHAKKRNTRADWAMYKQLAPRFAQMGMPLMTPIECKQNPDSVKEQCDLMVKMGIKNNPIVDYYNLVESIAQEHKARGM